MSRLGVTTLPEVIGACPVCQAPLTAYIEWEVHDSERDLARGVEANLKARAVAMHVEHHCGHDQPRPHTRGTGSRVGTMGTARPPAQP